MDNLLDREGATPDEKRMLSEVLAQFIADNRDEIIRRVIERIKAEEEIAAAQ